ncbi:uncharacterized protein LOC110824252 [Carica papaya]|uniref:uncharacterized protein LOC110824252 n=1 Tax=Carica papaya TaxID=3649 RepID=UPI000B8CC1E8|nr:uncharacterized protein LOC110824252 [Carica papaya]
MAKKRNKKSNGAVRMDFTEPTVSDVQQAMDTSESGASKLDSSALNRTQKKGRLMKRAKNVRKLKAVAKAISQNEKIVQKLSKTVQKGERTQAAKLLYD